jgi:hypothetical protein
MVREIPVRPIHGAVHHQPESLNLRIGPAVARDHWHFTHSLRDGALQPKVTVNYLAIGLGEDRHGEAKFADAGPDLINGFVVLTWIALVRLEPLDGPILDAELGKGFPRFTG